MIRDAPRFPHRGLLIDSARHFLPTKTIQRIIDAMSMMKMNVLHWHITDHESFPIVSRRYPQLSAKGAYHPLLVYSQEDVRQLISYATKRGIRIMPEFDMPGHSIFRKGGPPNITIPECYGALDPTRDSTFTFLREFLVEMAALFPEPLFALGGDEVSFNPCAAEPRKRWLTDHNMTAQDLLPHFWRRVVSGVKAQISFRLRSKH